MNHASLAKIFSQIISLESINNYQLPQKSRLMRHNGQIPLQYLSVINIPLVLIVAFTLIASVSLSKEEPKRFLDAHIPDFNILTSTPKNISNSIPRNTTIYSKTSVIHHSYYNMSEPYTTKR